MRVVLLLGDQPNQWALARKLATAVEVSAVVLSGNLPSKPPQGGARSTARRMAKRVAGGVVGWPLSRAWRAMLGRYGRELRGDLPGEIVSVSNVNADATVALIRRQAPDLVVVSGTNMVGSVIISESCTRSGIVNLHTGISPYVKGGPNCTNWCLALGHFCLIGNTVMWLDAGIDSGPIIATERTPLSGTESLGEIHWKVMEHAHDLYVRAIGAIRDGRPVARVPQQEIGEGRTFYNRDWTAWARVRAIVNHRVRYSAAALEYCASRRPLSLVPLPGSGGSPTG